MIANNHKRAENDEDLHFWKTNGDNHDQNFSNLYDIDLTSLYKPAVKDFYKHIVSQRVEVNSIISNVIEKYFDLRTVTIKDLEKILIRKKKLVITSTTQLAGLCFYFKVYFNDFEGNRICTLSTEPGVRTHWKQAVAYFNNLIDVTKGSKTRLNLIMTISDHVSYDIYSELIIGKNKYLKHCNTTFESL